MAMAGFRSARLGAGLVEAMAKLIRAKAAVGCVPSVEAARAGDA